MFKRILVPTDGSLRSDHSAHAAVELAKFLNATVVGLYVYPTFHMVVSEPFVAAPELISEKAYEAGQQITASKYLGVIEKAAQAAGVHCVTMTVSNDNPVEGIVAAASSSQLPCDLIFIGAHGRGILSQLFLGSVTTKVQAMCDIPVLVYRDPTAHPKVQKKAA